MEHNGTEYPETWEGAIDMVLEVISEMMHGENLFHNPTLEELEQRIV
jgi:hypothetical protein